MADWIMLKGERHTVTQCGTCGVWYTVPEIVYDCHRKEGGFHSCPNGHQRGWRTGEEEAERNKVRQERDRLKQDAARLNDELAAERRRAEEAERKAAKARKRTVAGVCPCCNRTFRQLALHMKSKHPSVVKLEQKSA